MWSTIGSLLKIFGLLLNYWGTSNAEVKEKKKALLMYYEAREKFSKNQSAKDYWESKRLKEKLNEENN